MKDKKYAIACVNHDDEYWFHVSWYSFDFYYNNKCILIGGWGERCRIEDLTLIGAPPLAAQASPTRTCFEVHEDRSVMFTRLADAPTRFTSPPLLFRSCPVEMQYAPGLSRCSGASGCSRPLLTYRFAECSSLLIVLMRYAQ